MHDGYLRFVFAKPIDRNRELYHRESSLIMEHYKDAKKNMTNWCENMIGSCLRQWHSIQSVHFYRTRIT